MQHIFPKDKGSKREKPAFTLRRWGFAERAPWCRLRRTLNEDKALTQTDPEVDFFSQANEYALGLLNRDEMQAFEAEMATNPALQGEVDRCILHNEQMGVERDDLAGSPPLGKLLWRELWGENWMPWRRRMRLWEFALGGVAAALLAYGVYQTDWFGAKTSPVLQASLSAQEHRFELQALLDPSGQVLHVDWRGLVPEGLKFVLWVKSGDADILIGALEKEGLQSFKLGKAQVQALTSASLLLVTLEEQGAAPSPAWPIEAQGTLREM
ncbi:hypothetical protein [Planktotalea arctica]|uniref:hypothetical protein n=1 Tax=Planktotalea arctica TaxID=1481893 RepID=UPI00111BEE99|nr:hypothetical protein [Planktotalea arctica]